MLEDLKKEMNSFLNDVNQNIKDENDLIYIKERTSKLLDVMMNEVEKLVDYKEDKLNAIVKKQQEEEFEIYLDYHLKICKRKDLMGYSSHILEIIEKK